MKRVLTVAVVFCLALAARAEYLNWLVNVGDTSSSYDAARLMKVGSETTTGGKSIAETSMASGVGTPQSIQLAAGDTSAWFYIELGNYSTGTFTASQVAGAYSYSQLVSAGLITGDNVNPATGLSFGVSGVTINGSPMTYSAVPEPGTASLIILGLAIAGLKRRRA